jgi:hypothetical protein
VHNRPVDSVAELDDLWAQLRTAAPRPAGADRGARRAAGVYFTPAPLAAHVCRVVLAPLLAAARWERGVPALRVADPAAGDGGFLAAALDEIAAAATALGIRCDGAWRRRAAKRCLLGVERDAELAARARARTGAIVFEREALLDAPAELDGVDAVVGNPPYVRSIRLRRADPALWSAVRGRFAATSHGEWDLYGAFVERTLDWLRPGGRAGLVVPSRWLTAAFAAPLRAKLAAAGAVRGVLDFGAAQVFPDATTYASVVVLETATPPRPVDVARLGARGWSAGAVPAASLAGAPWVLAVGADAALRARLAERGPPLGAVARIVKGAGTNADPVYVLEDCTIDRARAIAGGVEVELAATRPCLRGRDVVAFGRIDEAAPHTRVIVPYDGADPIPMAELARRWPRAAAHLRRHRSTLEAREDGRFAGAEFHVYGRPQNLVFHADPAPKVVVPDVARAGRAMIDDRGSLVLDTAYAIRPLPGQSFSPPLLALILSSPLVALWLRIAGVPLRGGYVRLKTAYLAPLPLPPPSAETDRAATLAARGDLAAALEHLRLAYGLDRGAWESDRISSPGSDSLRRSKT